MDSNQQLIFLQEGGEEVDGEEEHLQIQLQHKMRQQMLLKQLDKLREKHKIRKLNQLYQLGDEATSDGLINLDDDVKYVTSGNSGLSGNHSEFSSRRNVCEKNPNIAKWYHPMRRHLNQAHSYVQRKGRRVEQFGKLIPSPSSNFERRCTDLRQDLLKLELNIQRFTNIFARQLENVESKMKAFMSDFHLESFAHQLEFEDRQSNYTETNDQFSDSLGDNSVSVTLLRNNNTKSSLSSKKPETAPQMDISIISKAGSNLTGYPELENIIKQENRSSMEEDCRDLDPVPEIRDTYEI